MFDKLLGKEQPRVDLFAAAEAGKPVTIFAAKPKTWWEKFIDSLKSIAWSLTCGVVGWVCCLVYQSF